MDLTPPVHRWIDYDMVCALRGALRKEDEATCRQFGTDGNSFVAYVLDPASDLPVYVGVTGPHPEHGEITVFWPKDTAQRDHGYWTITDEVDEAAEVNVRAIVDTIRHAARLAARVEPDRSGKFAFAAGYVEGALLDDDPDDEDEAAA